MLNYLYLATGRIWKQGRAAASCLEDQEECCEAQSPQDWLPLAQAKENYVHVALLYRQGTLLLHYSKFLIVSCSGPALVMGSLHVLQGGSHLM